MPPPRLILTGAEMLESFFWTVFILFIFACVCVCVCVCIPLFLLAFA